MNQISNISYEIFTLDNIYTNEKINEFIKYIDNQDETVKKFTDHNFKNGKIINTELSEYMFNSWKTYLPSIYTDRNGIKWEPVSAANYVMYSTIKSGEMFGLHTDTGCYYFPPSQSKFTVLTYLNDDFIGGSTQFYTNSLHKTYEILPEKGKTLIFDIDLFHQGNIVTFGEKYWIGSEIICKRL